MITEDSTETETAIEGAERRRTEIWTVSWETIGSTKREATRARVTDFLSRGQRFGEAETWLRDGWLLEKQKIIT
jgi:hypothetical protein